MQYADPETRVAAWLADRLDVKIWADPALPGNWRFTSPIGHLQRSAGEGDTRLTLDTAILDLSFYCDTADTVRDLAEKARYEIRVNLPGHTWADGLFCTGTQTVSAPAWLPDPSVYRRGASYRVILHGLI